MRRRAIVLAAVGAVAFIACAPRSFALQDGDLLGPANWKEAEGLLPEEILEHYRRGEYLNRIADLSKPGYISVQHPSDFQEASLANRGLFALSDTGSVVERASGRQPRFLMGLPFPDLDPVDPQIATKVIWNYFYSAWYNGNEHFLNELLLLNARQVERRIMTDVQTLMYDGAPEARGRPNPDNLLMQRFARVTFPVDLDGTSSLSWRFRDPYKRDTLWTYVPGIRRVRSVDPLNRSDGFLGSDISLDDGYFFDAKPEDFTFRLLERRDQLVLMDPYSIRGEAEILPVSGGGWRILWKEAPRIGADSPDWSGLPWAPITAVLVRRPMWIIEAIPKDRKYLYGRVILRFDVETYSGSFASKYDRAGKLLLTYQASTGAYYSGDGGKTHIPAGGTTVRTGENFYYRRATVVLFPPRRHQNPSDYRIPLSPTLFNVDALYRIGK
jgi:hypothetical protein